MTADVFTRPDEKRRFVRRMFDGIAGTYDLLNHVLSAGFDIRWRKAAVAALDPGPGSWVLDLATGTGDLGFESARRGAPVVGADLSIPMLRCGVEKAAGTPGVRFLCGDAESLPFPEASFDGLTIGFGVRNFSRLDVGLSEMCRVLRPGGKAVVLEFSRPGAFGLRHLYGGYFRHILPRLGRLVSGDPQAYGYLYESVMRFPEGPVFCRRMEAAGFVDVREQRLTAGIATLYTGLKPPGRGASLPESEQSSRPRIAAR